MTPIASLAGAAGAWQNLYLLVGAAAATLIGLMFVAVTFGASLVTEQTSASARAFLDPTFTHFAQVLFTACLMVIPSMSPTLLGALLVLISVVRATALLRVSRHMSEAQRLHHDIEVSDWLSGIVLPLLCYVLLAGSGVAFLRGYAVAFGLLAVVTIALLMLGVFGAWELLVWMAVARTRVDGARQAPDTQTGDTNGLPRTSDS